MTTTTSPIEEILELTDYSDVAYRRTDLEGGFGEIWDITLPDEGTTVRVCDTDGQIEVYLFTGGRAQICEGQMTFVHTFAAPAYVAAALDQIVADHL
jgi:hypothetical protein